MSPENSNQNLKPQTISRKRKWFTFIGAIILVVLIAGTVFARIEGNRGRHINDFSYKGNNLVPSSVGGLSFSKPMKFISTAKKAAKTTVRNPLRILALTNIRWAIYSYFLIKIVIPRTQNM